MKFNTTQRTVADPPPGFFGAILDAIGRIQGQGQIVWADSRITRATIIVASITETVSGGLTTENGDAFLTLNNVVPLDGSCYFYVTVNWGNPLPVQVRALATTL